MSATSAPYSGRVRVHNMSVSVSVSQMCALVGSLASVAGNRSIGKECEHATGADVSPQLANAPPPRTSALLGLLDTSSKNQSFLWKRVLVLCTRVLVVLLLILLQ